MSSWREIYLTQPPSQLTRLQGAFFRRADEILFYVWDPIGVSIMSPTPRDEYHSYLPQVFKMVVEGAEAKVVTDHLVALERGPMGLSLSHKPAEAFEARVKVCQKVAKLLISDWADFNKSKA